MGKFTKNKIDFYYQAIFLTKFTEEKNLLLQREKTEFTSFDENKFLIKIHHSLFDMVLAYSKHKRCIILRDLPLRPPEIKTTMRETKKLYSISIHVRRGRIIWGNNQSRSHIM